MKTLGAVRLGTIATVVLLLAPAHLHGQTRAGHLMSLARQQIENLNNDSAFALLQQGLDPRAGASLGERAWGFVLLGIAQLSRDDRTLAKQAFEQALRLDQSYRIDSLAYLHSDALVVFGEARAAAEREAAPAPLLLTVPVASVVVSPSGATMSAVGGRQGFSAQARDANGTVISGKTPVWAILDPTVATINSSTGVATAVGSGQVEISATVEGKVGYALLTVAVPGAVPVASWSPMPSGTTAWLRSVWGTSAGEVYAVGQGGTILRLDGNSWSRMTSGTTDSLFGVWGTSASQVYAVGGWGTILRFDGRTWSPMPSATSANLWGVWGVSASDVYAVGQGGTILHFDGRIWSPMPSGTTANLRGVWGSSASEVYVVGDGGTALHFNGSSWSPMPSATSASLWGVWGISASHIYAVGQGGTILRFDGSRWSSMTSGTPDFLLDFLLAVWGGSTTDVYAVGTWGTILHYNGTSWSRMPSGTHAELYCVWGTSAGDVYVAGERGAILGGLRGPP